MSKPVNEDTFKIAKEFWMFVPKDPELFTDDLFKDIEEYLREEDLKLSRYRKVVLDMYNQVKLLGEDPEKYERYKAHFEVAMTNSGLFDDCREIAYALILDLSKDYVEQNCGSDTYNRNAIKEDMRNLEASLNSIEVEDLMNEYRGVDVDQFIQKFRYNLSEDIYMLAYEKAKRENLLSPGFCDFYDTQHQCDI